MSVSVSDHRFSPKLAVFAPLVVLTLIFAALIAMILAQSGVLVNPALLVSGLAVYGIAAALLISYGLSNIAKLETLGLTDSLSLLPNRRALHLDIERQASAGEETALALIDLDGFKQVNDLYGHFVGDHLIKDCAVLLGEVCGQEARVYRLGGDEFAVFVTGPIAGNILEGICHKLLIRLTLPFHIEGRAIIVGASIGLARKSSKNRTSSSELLRQTDVAMYASKRAGKMRCTWFNTEFDRSRDAIRALDDALREGIVHDEFRVHYQPLVDAHSCRTVGLEALLRWERRDGVIVAPDVFVPIAEDSGLINVIGLWVLRQACTDALPWAGVKLSVNVSAAQLRNPEFPIELGQVLEETGFPPGRLELEVTETHLVVDSVVAGRSLEVIRGFGVGIVLDDFGTGYASIGFLRQFRFEKLKIDRSLIVDAALDVGSRAMMLASVVVARSLDMDVTAEGVETEAQADLVRSAGCDQIQGWLYHKAMTADEVTVHLADQADSSKTPLKSSKSRAA
ncbi:MAG: bifunctional diguanylate cyclase/phosphodiesterase [Novosphingobium sp.]